MRAGGRHGRRGARRSRVTDCPLLVRPKTDKFRVRLWTTDGSAQVTTSFKSSPPQRVKIDAAGLYKTTAQSFCLPATQSGPLRRCGRGLARGGRGRVRRGDHSVRGHAE